MSAGAPGSACRSLPAGRSLVAKYLLRTIILTAAIVALSASPAFAYRESTTTVLPGATPSWSCPSCHGLEAGVSSPTVAPRAVPSTWTWDSEAGTNVGTRKGPHGGYTTGTQKCAICHKMHDAPAGGSILLPDGNSPLLTGPTLTAVCYTCHDGTGGGGVYGVIQFRTGINPAASGAVHRVDVTTAPTGMLVPGGAADGSTITTAYSGPSGSLSCVDCHSPHNAGAVMPFLGDRKRSPGDTSSASIATNRLLRSKPTKAASSTTQYGSDWCEGCHSGRHNTAGNVDNHPVADQEASATGANGWWYYNKVNILSGVNTTSSVITSGLGQSNFGYLMPVNQTTGARIGTQGYPICQQCHEDARNVGNQVLFAITTPAVPAETFQVSSTDGTQTADNPRFQNFPHESLNPNFLIETGDSLCLNCHLPPP